MNLSILHQGTQTTKVPSVLFLAGTAECTACYLSVQREVEPHPSSWTYSCLDNGAIQKRECIQLTVVISNIAIYMSRVG